MNNLLPSTLTAKARAVAEVAMRKFGYYSQGPVYEGWLEHIHTMSNSHSIVPFRKAALRAACLAEGMDPTHFQTGYYELYNRFAFERLTREYQYQCWERTVAEVEGSGPGCFYSNPNKPVLQVVHGGPRPEGEGWELKTRTGTQGIESYCLVLSGSLASPRWLNKASEKCNEKYAAYYDEYKATLPPRGFYAPAVLS